MLELTSYQKGLLLSIRRWQLHEVPFTNSTERYAHLEVIRFQGQFVPRSFVIWDAPWSGDFWDDDDHRLESYELVRFKSILLQDSLSRLLPNPPFTFPLLSGGTCAVTIGTNESVPEHPHPELRILAHGGKYWRDSVAAIDHHQPHVHLTWRGLELADILLKKKTRIKIDRWHPPTGFIGTKEIVSDKRYQKDSKNPSRSTIQTWEKTNPPPDRIQDQETQEVYFPKQWVSERLKGWSPRKLKGYT